MQLSRYLGPRIGRNLLAPFKKERKSSLVQVLFYEHTHTKKISKKRFLGLGRDKKIKIMHYCFTGQPRVPLFVV